MIQWYAVIIQNRGKHAVQNETRFWTVWKDFLVLEFTSQRKSMLKENSKFEIFNFYLMQTFNSLLLLPVRNLIFPSKLRWEFNKTKSQKFLYQKVMESQLVTMFLKSTQKLEIFDVDMNWLQKTKRMTYRNIPEKVGIDVKIQNSPQTGPWITIQLCHWTQTSL